MHVFMRACMFQLAIYMDILCHHIQVREDLKTTELQGFSIMCLASFDEMWGKKHIIDGNELVVEFQVWKVHIQYDSF